MGNSASGKTSMRSIIFANFLPRETGNLLVTTGAEKVPEVKFLDDLSLNLWDCGGQDVFWENYFLHKADIFSSVHCMIFVFNIESKDPAKEMHNYKRCIDALREFSADAKIFCLIHKMDLVPEGSDKQRLVSKKEAEIKTASGPFRSVVFTTSIWDDTLYHAWSEIVNSMIPRREVLVQHLEHMAKACEAAEVLLFERATFLVLATAGLRPYKDIERFEKLSSIIKTFKLSCNKAAKGAQFNEIELKNSHFHATGSFLTPNTFVLVVTEPSIPRETLSRNLSNARPHFTKLFEQLRAVESNKKKK